MARSIIAAWQSRDGIYLSAAPSLYSYRTSKALARKRSKPALYGLHSIDRYTRDGQELALNCRHHWTSVAMNVLWKALARPAATAFGRVANGDPCKGPDPGRDPALDGPFKSAARLRYWVFQRNQSLLSLPRPQTM